MYETKNETIFSALLCIVFGLVLCLFNVSILTTLTQMIGILSILFAIFFFYCYFQKRTQTTIITLILSLFLLVVGIYMCLASKKFISILPMLTGIVLIVNSFAHFQKVLVLKDNQFDKWKVNLGGAIFILLLGIILLMKPIQSLNFIFSLTGAFLILNGVLILLNQYILEKTNSSN